MRVLVVVIVVACFACAVAAPVPLRAPAENVFDEIADFVDTPSKDANLSSTPEPAQDPLAGTKRGAFIADMRKVIRGNPAAFYAVLTSARMAEALGAREVHHKTITSLSKQWGLPTPAPFQHLSYLEWVQTVPGRWTEKDQSLLDELDAESASLGSKGHTLPVFWSSLRVSLLMVKAQSDPSAQKPLSTL